jgi:hypothetical protein
MATVERLVGASMIQDPAFTQQSFESAISKSFALSSHSRGFGAMGCCFSRERWVFFCCCEMAFARIRGGVFVFVGSCRRVLSHG